jgi:3-oxoacyl-[acyl-carrier-protein] synthase II
LALKAAREALVDSGRIVDTSRIGLVVASTGMGDVALERALGEPSRDPEWWQECLKGSLADELASILRLGGFRQVVNTACSSGAIAIALGCEGLDAGDYDMVLAVGCDELTRIAYSGFNSLRALDPGPCRPFDVARRGMTLGEGAGCLVLERLTDARRQSKRIHAVVAGAGWACDANHLTAPDPAGLGAAIAISKALEHASVLASDIGFVNAHGTGTPLNDSAEISAILKALGKHAVSCKVHSIKASTGHCMGAAGTIEAIVAILSLQHGVVPATVGLSNCEFDGSVDCVKVEPRVIRKSFGISNSFGFGGNDATLVFAHPDSWTC